MSKKDVTDTVDIFFGTGRVAPKTEEERKVAAEVEQLAREYQELEESTRELRKNRTDKAKTTAVPVTPAASVAAPLQPQTMAEEPTAATKAGRERVSFILPAEQAEFLKNYKYCRALMDGDPQYTMTEAIIEAIELLRLHSKYEVFERPDFVRAREERRTGRR